MSPERAVKISKRKTKIVCTLGPAVDSADQIKMLMRAGMDVVRINCSHGDPESRVSMVRLVRKCARALNLFIPIIFDLQGPKIRVGLLEEPLDLAEGSTLRIMSGKGSGDASRIFTSYEHLARDVRAGEPILMDDGKIRLRVERVRGAEVVCKVEVGGILTQKKGINLPDTKISAPSLSDKDLADLEIAIRQDLDFVAVSFVRGAQDMIGVRREAKKIGEHNLQFISKIERPEALKELIPIINTSDGVMVARGDLGVEIGSHRVPMRQKEIITRANLAGRFVITATQMLESMMERPIPTRAEASDVANAILDGTDACMLSGETATGGYPIEAVAMMVKIAREAESHTTYRYQAPNFSRGSIHHIPDGVSIAAFQTANLMGARLLVAFTNSGSSALRLSKRHPQTLIVGATIHERIARRMRSYWGVVPVLIKKPASVEEMFEEVKQKIMELDLVREGDVAVLTAGYPLWTSESTNLMKIIEI